MLDLDSITSVILERNSIVCSRLKDSSYADLENNLNEIYSFIDNVINWSVFREIFRNCDKDEKEKFIIAYMYLMELVEYIKTIKYNKLLHDEENYPSQFYLSIDDFSLSGVFDEHNYPYIRDSYYMLLLCDSINALNFIISYFSSTLDRLNSDSINGKLNDNYYRERKKSYEKVLFACEVKLATINNKGNLYTVKCAKEYIKTKGLIDEINQCNDVNRLDEIINQSNKLINNIVTTMLSGVNNETNTYEFIIYLYKEVIGKANDRKWKLTSEDIKLRYRK